MKRILLTLILTTCGLLATAPIADAARVEVRRAIPIIREERVVVERVVPVIVEADDDLRLVSKTREEIFEPDGDEVIITRRVYEEPDGDRIVREERRVIERD